MTLRHITDPYPTLANVNVTLVFDKLYLTNYIIRTFMMKYLMYLMKYFLPMMDDVMTQFSHIYSFINYCVVRLPEISIDLIGCDTTQWTALQFQDETTLIGK